MWYCVLCVLFVFDCVGFGLVFCVVLCLFVLLLFVLWADSNLCCVVAMCLCHVVCCVVFC